MAAPARSPRKDDQFYEMMREHYAHSPDLKRHQSPTKRLIAQKNTTWTHKAGMAKHCP